MDPKEPDDTDEDEMVEDVVVILLEDEIEDNQMVEDVVDVVPSPVVEIAHITIVWATEMAAQPGCFIIGEVELDESIVEVASLTAAVEATEGDIDNYAENDVEDNVKDDDIIILENLNDEIEELIPDEMTFRSDDEIPPYKSDVKDF